MSKSNKPHITLGDALKVSLSDLRDGKIPALVAQGKEQGSSKPEVAGSNPAEGAKPVAWICMDDAECSVTLDADFVRKFMDRSPKWTVTPLYTRSSELREALRKCSLADLEAEYVRRSQGSGRHD